MRCKYVIYVILLLCVTSVYGAGRTVGRSVMRGAVTPPGQVTTSSSVGAPRVVARAGTTQKVVSSGTTVNAAVAMADNDCTQKFNGCMDAFCMVGNTNGGRCVCNNKIHELNKELSEIENTDAKSYQMATFGVDIIENNIDTTLPNTRARRATSNASMIDVDDTTVDVSLGAALYSQSLDVCFEQMPECASSRQFLIAQYSQKIKSDCNAYENSLKQQKNSSAQKLSAAEQALRAAALEQLRTSNKYDLGQCTTEFKKCMASTAGCGDDFTGCVGIAAAENSTRTSSATKSKAKQYTIQGSATQISIAASSYDTLESKKPMCENVTKSCVRVADQVWPTFLREVAPQIKTAELIAESNLRSSCISNISQCFQKACKDTMDPNDPDGSYDLCLSRPESIKSLCKVQIDPCIAAEPLIMDFVEAKLAAMRVDACTNEIKSCLQSSDRCGKDYTQCVGLDTDTIIRMCPSDKLLGCQQQYGTTDIRDEKIYDELDRIVRGIFLGIDNNMLTYCQNALDESMVRVCGDTSNCNANVQTQNIGYNQLRYEICEWQYDDKKQIASINYNNCRDNVEQIKDVELGRVDGTLTGEMGPVTPFVGVVHGYLYWNEIKVHDDGVMGNADEYFKSIGINDEITERDKTAIAHEINTLQSNISRTVNTIESDPTVRFCMTGRQVPGIKTPPNGPDARFPKLSVNMRHTIAAAAIKDVMDRYNVRADKMDTQMMTDYVKIAERQAAIRGENAKDVRREIARQSCINLAPMSTLPMSPPKVGKGMTWVAVGIVVAAIAVTVLTVGSAGPQAAYVAAMADQMVATAAAGSAVATYGATSIIATEAIITQSMAISAAVAAETTLTAVTTALAISAGALAAGVATAGVTMATRRTAGDVQGTRVEKREMSGHYEMNQWNDRQTINTLFDWDTLNCHKCVRRMACENTHYSAFGASKCRRWGEPTETCSDVQF